MGLHYTVYIAAIAVLALLLVYRFIVPAHDAREPPTVHSRIPFIGHAINVSRQGRKYYAKLW